jgi:hypothetical protein
MACCASINFSEPRSGNPIGARIMYFGLPRFDAQESREAAECVAFPSGKAGIEDGMSLGPNADLVVFRFRGETLIKRYHPD